MCCPFLLNNRVQVTSMQFFIWLACINKYVSSFVRFPQIYSSIAGTTNHFTMFPNSLHSTLFSGMRPSSEPALIPLIWMGGEHQGALLLLYVLFEPVKRHKALRRNGTLRKRSTSNQVTMFELLSTESETVCVRGCAPVCVCACECVHQGSR